MPRPILGEGKEGWAGGTIWGNHCLPGMGLTPLRGGEEAAAATSWEGTDL